MAQDRPVLGEWCEVRAQVIKMHEKRHTSWHRCELSKSKKVLYVGYRYVHSGEHVIDHEFGEYGTLLSTSSYFDRRETFHVFMFMVNDRENPIYAFPEDVVWEKDKSSGKT